MAVVAEVAMGIADEIVITVDEVLVVMMAGTAVAVERTSDKILHLGNIGLARQEVLAMGATNWRKASECREI